MSMITNLLAIPAAVITAAFVILDLAIAVCCPKLFPNMLRLLGKTDKDEDQS